MSLIADIAHRVEIEELNLWMARKRKNKPAIAESVHVLKAIAHQLEQMIQLRGVSNVVTLVDRRKA